MACRGLLHMGNDTDIFQMNYAKAGQVEVDWAAIEPSRGTFNWSSATAKLASYDSGANGGKRAADQGGRMVGKGGERGGSHQGSVANRAAYPGAPARAGAAAMLSRRP